MEAIKLKPQILTKEFGSVPHSQRTPKVKDKGEPKERNYRNKCLQVREREKGYEQVMPLFLFIFGYFLILII